jgi:hypothetical protein
MELKKKSLTTAADVTHPKPYFKLRPLLKKDVALMMLR